MEPAVVSSASVCACANTQPALQASSDGKGFKLYACWQKPWHFGTMDTSQDPSALVGYKATCRYERLNAEGRGSLAICLLQ